MVVFTNTEITDLVVGIFNDFVRPFFRCRCCYPTSFEEWGMAEDNEAQKLDNSPGPEPEVVERQKVAKE